MVDLMNGIDKLKGTDWQDLRTSICDGLKSRRNDRVLEILKATHFNAHVIFLQEAGIQLVDLISRTMSGDEGTYEVWKPEQFDAKKSQNSVILLRKGYFNGTKEIVVR